MPGPTCKRSAGHGCAPDDSAYVAAFLSSVPGPFVLVGHSYGGAVVTNAATGNENVKALVYVDAFRTRARPSASSSGPRRSHHAIDRRRTDRRA